MLTVLAVAAPGGGGSRPAASVESEAASLPASPRPAFTVGKPVLLRHPRAVARWAPVLRAVNVRRAPTAGSAPVTELSTETPEGTANLVLVVGEATRNGRVWVRVRLPVLPNNTVGWVPRTALGGYAFVHTHLVVDLARLVATLFVDGRPVFRAPVGVGRSEWPTPRGEFYIRDKVTSFDNAFYGPLAFGTSARSGVLTDWPAGGFVGIHGTNEPQLIPGRISHGCIRLRNTDILRLGRLMPIGTPLTIS